MIVLTPQHNVGRKVQVRRLELGLQQADLAAQAKVDPKTLRSLEKGERWPRASSRSKVEDALDWPAGALDRMLAAAMETATKEGTERPVGPGSDPERLTAPTWEDLNDLIDTAVRRSIAESVVLQRATPDAVQHALTKRDIEDAIQKALKNAAAPAGIDARPIAFDRAGAIAYTGFSKTTLDNLLREGKILARKQNSKNLFLRESLDRYINGLPLWGDADTDIPQAEAE